MILDRLQNRAPRFVYNLKIFGHISAKVWSNLGFSDLKTVNMVHKILLTGKPEYLRNTLVSGYLINLRIIRQYSLLHLPKTKHGTGEKG